MITNACAERALDPQHLPPFDASPSPTGAALDFGRFRLLLHQRQLFAGGGPTELRARAFEALLALLEAGGSLVTKDELISRVWPGIVVIEGNLKVQISSLRKAFGEDRNHIRTELGRGYRFTAAVHSRNRRQSPQRLAPQWLRCRWRPCWGLRADAGNRFEPSLGEAVISF
ncbi:MAG: winged helix-turn-helix domain-containing protein [Alphaproteobacteria bacterium]|nr:winged helix-turn-helix domain-containing protein [Alphaproteobacteria bacterium]